MKALGHEIAVSVNCMKPDKMMRRTRVAAEIPTAPMGAGNRNSGGVSIAEGTSGGRIDIGIVREDAVPKEIKRWRLGLLGYSLCAANAFWQGRTSVGDGIQKTPVWGFVVPGCVAIPAFPSRLRAATHANK